MMSMRPEKAANANVIPHPAVKKAAGRYTPAPAQPTVFAQAPYGDNGFDALFLALDSRRSTVIAFVKMKLDRIRRTLFIKELKACETIEAQGRCVKRYIQHLKINDVRALLRSLPGLLPRCSENSCGNRPGGQEQSIGALPENQAMLSMLFFLTMPSNH